jgi:aminoglycoside 3-N-acetyltransferase
MVREKNRKSKVCVSKEDIKAGLKKLGIKKGDVVGAHSSLSSFGYVKGGADAVIDALLEVVGKEGTIVMPTHSNNLEKVELSPKEKATGVSWLFKILSYDPKETPCTTGIIPETFRKRPGVIRSRHPSLSIAAIGPKAEEITGAEDGRSLAGWKVVLQLDGYILLMGVGLEVCTAMHLAENMVQLPEHILKKITPPKWFVEKYPEDKWEWDVGPYPKFAKLLEPCLQNKIMETIKIGNAILRLVKLQDLIDLYVEYLQKNPDIFYS